ncbi:MAG TPA: CDP-alcohol phosphatidyltransferase family protein [Bauldia sp.]|nr:CDP-alcohol phosphatidyltransferase family protein [Bauldia sp.]
MFVTIPNLISIGRLFLVPLTIWLLISARPDLAFWVFLLAGFSDALDGFLARRFNMKSDLGGYLDPLADKALLISIYVTFAALNEVHVWVTILIVTRDILIIGGVIIAWMLAVPMAMRPNWISKVNTLGQIVYAAVILADLAFTANLTTLRMELAWVVGGLTVISTFAYALEFVRHMGGVEGPGTPSPPARP